MVNFYVTFVTFSSHLVFMSLVVCTSETLVIKWPVICRVEHYTSNSTHSLVCVDADGV